MTRRRTESYVISDLGISVKLQVTREKTPEGMVALSKRLTVIPREVSQPNLARFEKEFPDFYINKKDVISRVRETIEANFTVPPELDYGFTPDQLRHIHDQVERYKRVSGLENRTSGYHNGRAHLNETWRAHLNERAEESAWVLQLAKRGRFIDPAHLNLQ